MGNDTANLGELIMGLGPMSEGFRNPLPFGYNSYGGKKGEAEVID